VASLCLKNLLTNSVCKGNTSKNPKSLICALKSFSSYEMIAGQWFLIYELITGFPATKTPGH